MSTSENDNVMHPEDLDWAIKMISGLAYGRESMCDDRIRYDSPMQARGGMPKDISADVTPCPWCLGWHIMFAMGDLEKRMWGDLLGTILR